MSQSRRQTRTARPQAALLPFPDQRGGARKGSGRKPNGDTAGVKHRQRDALASRHPAHITVKLKQGLPKLRQKAEHAALRAAFAAGCTGPAAAATFRLCHYTILNDHLHFLVEAKDRTALTRGLQGLLIRIAKTLNKLWRRRGKVFADRYHDRVLRSPREVRNALRYVLANGKKHAHRGRAVRVSSPIDTFSSAPWFDGFRETFTVSFTVRGFDVIVRPVTDARTWMLTQGWRRHDLIDDLPATG